MTIPLKLKVCGMRDPLNYKEVEALNPDYMGLIFYPGSPRYVEEGLGKASLARPNKSVDKVGVFVNASTANIVRTVEAYGCSLVQLHGNEPIEQCLEIQRKGYKVIKAFAMDSKFDFRLLEPYVPVVDFFLFDTKTPGRGGSGETFDWEILNAYNLDIPFFLSGGIGLEQLADLSKIKNPRLYALDVNSRFETSPGFKNVLKLRKLVKHLDSIQNEV